MNRILVTVLFAVIYGFLSSYAHGAGQHSKGGKIDYLMLGLSGYNYTDRLIEEYSVDGTSGGYIRQSSPTSGGSGTTCCVRLAKERQGIIRVNVRWQVDGCRYLVRDFTGRSEEYRHFFYREQEVDVAIPSGKNISYIESHFYPDGHVEVRLTDTTSLPSLKLDKTRPDRSKFPRCKNDKEPQ